MATDSQLTRFERLLRAAYRADSDSPDHGVATDLWRTELLRRVRTRPTTANLFELMVMRTSRIACAGALASVILAAQVGFEPTDAIIRASADDLAELGSDEIL